MQTNKIETRANVAFPYRHANAMKWLLKFAKFFKKKIDGFWLKNVLSGYLSLSLFHFLVRIFSLVFSWCQLMWWKFVACAQLFLNWNEIFMAMHISSLKCQFAKLCHSIDLFRQSIMDSVYLCVCMYLMNLKCFDPTQLCTNFII